MRTTSHEKEFLHSGKSTRHMVGDGFEIRRPMPSPTIESVNPFLVLDHAGPTEIEPSDTPRGVDEHPHRGFETVTVLYQGELEHRDSAGNSGRLKAGDVQWMTAASGIVHEEKHGKEFTRRGGTLELVQLWVNLPARHKSESPGYQDIRSDDIPVISLSDEAGFLRVIAGEHDGVRGAAKTFTPVFLYDVKLNAGASVRIPLQDGHNVGAYMVQGTVHLNDEHAVGEGEMALFGRDGEHIGLRTSSGARVLLLGGEPIDEPVVSYGPFVMNTNEEIEQAFADYRSGRMGTLDVRIRR